MSSQRNAPCPRSSSSCGVVVPIPTLLLRTEMGELPTADVPVNTGTVPEDPEPVTVCATALTANAAMQIASPLFFMLITLLAFRNHNPQLRFTRTLLKRNHRFDDTLPGIKIAKRLADHCSGQPAAVRSFHRISRDRRCDQEIAAPDGSILCAHLRRNNADHGHRQLRLAYFELCRLPSAHYAWLRRIDTSDSCGIWLA